MEDIDARTALMEDIDARTALMEDIDARTALMESLIGMTESMIDGLDLYRCSVNSSILGVIFT